MPSIDRQAGSPAVPENKPPPPNLYTPRGEASEFSADKYSIGQHTYPDDLYSNKRVYGGNYVVFYINVSEDSKLIKNDNAETVGDFPPRDRGDAAGNPVNLTAANATAGGIGGLIAGGLFTGDIKGAAKAGAAGAVGGAVVGALVAGQGTRAQKRLKTAIALHIPNQLQIRYGMQWSEDDTSILAMAGAAGEEVMKAVTTGSVSSGVPAGKAMLANLALAKGPNAGANSAYSGIAANPKKEQVFKGVDFRSFQFEYQFFPKDQKEARAISKIINEFKYHMHPEFKDAGNFLYIYPSEFDVFYYQNGHENLHLHRHTSCVLTEMNVNYTPNGQFNTFSDGMPTQINMTLSFRELALLTKDKVKDGL
jgi:hypothetical protein